MRAVVVGTGRMGTLVKAELEARGHEVIAWIGEDENRDGAALTPERLAGAEVAIEFTTPASAPRNIERLLEAGLAVVSGTTGCDAALPHLEHVARQHGALLHATNFSVGLHLMRRAAAMLARGFATHPEFDPHLVDVHHAAKLDAPSGTALTLARSIQEEAGIDVPITSIRTGTVPGTHTLSFEGPHESVTLAHTVRDRAVFAAGAVVAAEWLRGRHGVFWLDDVLFGRDG
jgi:4-hydroxy-tetrahydrodipicolinate reductase